jgi:hypothetical protein
MSGILGLKVVEDKRKMREAGKCVGVLGIREYDYAEVHCLVEVWCGAWRKA